MTAVQSSAPGRRASALIVTIATAMAVLTTGCDAQVEHPSRVLQSVNVDLTAAGAITAVNGTAVFLNEATNASHSMTTRYRPEEVVDELPVRVSTQYRTATSTGSDLADLASYNGRVEIDVTVENLTLKATELSYDAAGQARTAPALVGTPLSIAASTKLSGTPVSRLVFQDAATGQGGTNGIVSSASDGDAVIQWAALLVPPQSGATTTFRIVADAKDFSVPAIDITVQAGLNTDLSFDGVLNSAFDTDPNSELNLQRRTIELVTEVNAVLTKAGTTITEVRQNLDETSRTLGVGAAQQLAQSSQSLTSSMTNLSGQIATLQSDLDSSVVSTHSAATAQLAQIVTSMSLMMGDTSANVPTTSGLVEGTGCAAQVQVPDSGGTLFSAFLQLSAQLNGYADASAGCRDEIVQQLTTSIGPAEPTATACVNDTSLTCTLLGARTNVVGALDALVVSGQSLVAQLDSSTITDAISQYSALSASLTDITTKVNALSAPAGQPTLTQQLTALRASITAAQGSLNTITQINTTARAALADLTTGPGSLSASYSQLATEICALGTDPSVVIAPARLEQIRALVTDTPCNPSQPIVISPTSLQSRLASQQAYWQTVMDGTSPNRPGSAIDELDTVLQSFITALNPAITDAGTLEATSADLSTLVGTAQQHSAQLNTLLTRINQQQQGLASAVTTSFETAADTAKTEITQNTEAQIRIISTETEKGRASLIESYNRTIAGLTGTSEKVVADSKEQIDAQTAQLATEQQNTAAALDEQTTQALEQLALGAGNSTRDIEAASALLGDSLNKVMLDLGDPNVPGSGLLGSMTASAAKAGTADYQLALASQRAAGYANIRTEDVAGILLRQAQFRASLDRAATYPAFHLELPDGASPQTIFSFRVGNHG